MAEAPSSLGIGVDWAHKGVHLMRGGGMGGTFGDLGVGYAGSPVVDSGACGL